MLNIEDEEQQEAHEKRLLLERERREQNG